MSYCLAIPHFNHYQSFEAFLPKLVRLEYACTVVDDGSDIDQLQKLEALLSKHPEITLLKHGYNRGKGAAILTAANHARQAGHTHIIQIDADGQHNTDDIEKLIAHSEINPNKIVSGAPYFEASAPKARVYGRKVTNFWVAIETLSFDIKDSLCGFRVYPLREFEIVFDNYHIGKRMTFDTDVLVKSHWQGIKTDFIDTKVIYIENNVSHFHYLRDNLLLIKLHTRLMLGMLVRLPKIIIQKFN